MSALFDDATSGATLSPCGTYRYDLWRQWGSAPPLAWVMLNPSVADASVDDATIRRCIGFAKREGAGGIVVRNLFAYRTPKPAVLWKAQRDGVDIVGPDGNWWLEELAERNLRVVAAWGSPGPKALGRIDEALVLLSLRLERMEDLRYPDRITSHPLYLPEETPISSYPIQGRT